MLVRFIRARARAVLHFKEQPASPEDVLCKDQVYQVTPFVCFERAEKRRECWQLASINGAHASAYLEP